MNWKLISALSLLGVIMGIATVAGVAGWLEGLLWLLLGIVCAWIIARNASEKQFGHGFAVGLFAAALAHFTQILFFQTYAENNPEIAARLASSEAGLGDLGPRTFVLILTPFISIASGLVLGLFAWIAGKLVKPPAVIEV